MGPARGQLVKAARRGASWRGEDGPWLLAMHFVSVVTVLLALDWLEFPSALLLYPLLFASSVPPWINTGAPPRLTYFMSFFSHN